MTITNLANSLLKISQIRIKQEPDFGFEILVNKVLITVGNRLLLNWMHLVGHESYRQILCDLFCFDFSLMTQIFDNENAEHQ